MGFMRLLVCTSEYYPYGSGIANVAYNVVEQLKKMGIECTVCSPTGPDIKIKSLQGCGRIGLIHFWYKVGKYFKNKANDYDVVWLHYPLFLGNIPFKKCLVTVHSTAYGFMVKNISPKIYYYVCHLLDKLCLNKFGIETRFTGVSSKTCSELEMILSHKQPIKLIFNGVDTKIFKPINDKGPYRKKFGIPLDSKIILSVGRLVDHKMPFIMLDTFNEIQKKASNKYTLVVAGKGKLFEPLKEYVTKNCITNVLFLGYVPDKDLPQLYACSDYFIITSKYEGGEPVLTVTESMASGLPCIVSSIPNFGIIEKANSGIILDFFSDKLVAEKLINYLENSDYEVTSKNARSYVTEHMDWGILSKLYLDELKLM